MKRLGAIALALGVSACAPSHKPVAQPVSSINTTVASRVVGQFSTPEHDYHCDPKERFGYDVTPRLPLRMSEATDLHGPQGKYPDPIKLTAELLAYEAPYYRLATDWDPARIGDNEFSYSTRPLTDEDATLRMDLEYHRQCYGTSPFADHHEIVDPTLDEQIKKGAAESFDRNGKPNPTIQLAAMRAACYRALTDVQDATSEAYFTDPNHCADPKNPGVAHALAVQREACDPFIKTNPVVGALTERAATHRAEQEAKLWKNLNACAQSVRATVESARVNGIATYNGGNQRATNEDLRALAEEEDRINCSPTERSIREIQENSPQTENARLVATAQSAKNFLDAQLCTK